MFDGKYDIDTHTPEMLNESIKNLIFRTPVEYTLQNPWELGTFINEEITPRTLKSIVEIGAYKGGTLWNWIQLSKSNTKITVIDSYEIEHYDFVENPAIYYNVLFTQWAKDKNVNLQFIDGNSNDMNVYEQVRQYLIQME